MTSNSTTASDLEGATGTSRNWLKVVIGLAVLVALFFAARQFGGYVPRFAEWVEGLGFWGPVVFILGYAAATVAFVPGSLLTLSAGAVFGLAQGTLFAFLGASLGATLAFLTGRYFARSAIEQKVSGHPRFSAIDHAVEQQGLKIVTLLRLSPVFPFTFLNYALGLTRVRLGHYVLACLGMLPGTLLYVYYGTLIGNVASVASGSAPEKGTGYWVVMGLGLLATLVVTIFITRTARRALSDVEGMRSQAQEQAEQQAKQQAETA
jgi:uncharacterized membrane protein YdjX (TVP38/TMEM64 family)